MCRKETLGAPSTWEKLTDRGRAGEKEKQSSEAPRGCRSRKGCRKNSIKSTASENQEWKV